MRVVAGSDWVIDMGPGAGDEGGRIVASGTPQEVARSGRQPHRAVPAPLPLSGCRGRRIARRRPRGTRRRVAPRQGDAETCRAPATTRPRSCRRARRRSAGRCTGRGRALLGPAWRPARPRNGSKTCGSSSARNGAGVRDHEHDASRRASRRAAREIGRLRLAVAAARCRSGSDAPGPGGRRPIAAAGRRCCAHSITRSG